MLELSGNPEILRVELCPIAVHHQDRVRRVACLPEAHKNGLLEWKRRGLVTSYTDAIIQALRIMHEKIIE